MSSGIRYDETAPRDDNRVTYLDPDLRRAALNLTEIVEAPGQHWVYNNYHPLLLGMVFERVTSNTFGNLRPAGSPDAIELFLIRAREGRQGWWPIR